MSRLKSKIWNMLESAESKRDRVAFAVIARELRQTISAYLELSERAVASGQIVRPHPSPCPKCDPEEFQRLCNEAVSRALGVTGEFTPLDNRTKQLATPNGGYAGDDSELPILP
ncbi:MAG TPA: hypothetical protein VEJ47_14065 [Candidatus Eremiobacteraceae bacterium]|nr:hypothetical protein [Candidatus Eremiobacteraceae bacterium]